MSSKHKLRTFLQHGDPDLGAEIEAEIAFTFRPGSDNYYDRHLGTWEQGWGDDIELISAAPLCNGKPAPFLHHPAMEQESLNDLARDWLESDEGRAAALEEVAAELEDARAFVAALRQEPS